MKQWCLRFGIRQSHERVGSGEWWSHRWDKNGHVLITAEAGWQVHKGSSYYSLYFFMCWKCSIIKVFLWMLPSSFKKEKRREQKYQLTKTKPIAINSSIIWPWSLPFTKSHWWEPCPPHAQHQSHSKPVLLCRSTSSSCGFGSVLRS